MAVPAQQSHSNNRIAQHVPRPDRELLRSGRSRRGFPCPICSREDAQCIAYPRGKTIHAWCIRGEGHDGGRRLAWGFRGDIWYFELANDGNAAIRIRTPKTRHDWPVATPAIVDSVLREVATFYGLSDEHRAQLAARGYDAWNECGPDGRYLFATLPASPQSRLAIAARLLARRPDLSPQDILGVYGFRKDGRYSDAAIEFLPHIEGAALLEFAQDEAGHIIGYQYAPDSGQPAKRLTPTRFLISGRYHVARPAREADPRSPIWHTEGVHKANLVARHYSTLAVSAFGIGNTRGLEAAAKALDPKRRRVQVIALDMEDPESQAGKDVARAVARLAKNLAAAGYRVQIARWNREAGHGPDDAIAAGAAITLVDYTSPDKPPPRDRRLEHAYEWQRATMKHSFYTGMLEIIGGHMAGRVEEHLKDKDAAGAAYVLAAAPGLGKTHKIAEIGERQPGRKHGRVDIGWIAERLDMLEAVAAFAGYHHIEPPNDKNCPYGYLAHKELARRGYATYDLHRNHPTGECDYIKQFKQKGSAIYQLAHVKASYPASHKAIVVDEFDLSKWLEEYPATMSRLKTVASHYTPEHPIAVLMASIEAVMTDARAAFDAARAAKQAYAWPHGRALFDAINARCHGQLATLIGQLGQMAAATDEHPYPPGMDWNDKPDDLEAAATKLSPVILPHIWRALADEIGAWQRGGDWNSNLRLGQTGGGELTLFITEPRRFHDKAAPLPLAILDATPPPSDILERVIGRRVLPHDTPSIAPPSGMRHIAIRTGVRYGKYALTAQHGRDLARTIAQCQYILNQLDPDGSIRASGGVGVVTFDAIEQELCEGLGIAYQARSAHYWACRGANHLEDCPILLCVGTPTLPPDETMRLARAIYHRDPVALDETPNTDKDGHWKGYHDSRLQSLSRYLTHAEMTQAAHRNRPLRREARTVVTLCNVDDIGYLPATTTVTELPRVTGDGRTKREASDSARTARLEAAAHKLESEGVTLTASALALESSVAKSFTVRWLATYRQTRRDNIMYIAETVPDLLNNIYISNMGTDPAIPHSASAEISPISERSDLVNITQIPHRRSTPPNTFADRVDQLMAEGYSMEQAAILTLKERGTLPQQLDASP